MMNRMLVILLVITLCGAWGFGMTVPSSGGTVAPEATPVGGGSHLSDGELVLVVVGAVCCVILLLAIID